MIRFYKPNKSNSGCSCNFWLNLKDNTFWTSLLKQHSWDAKKGIGHFKESEKHFSKKVIVKFSEFEMCEILNAVRNKGQCSGYHSSKFVTRFKFSYYNMEDKNITGYSFKVQREDKEDSTKKDLFSISFSETEATRLYHYISNALAHIDSQSFNYSPDEKNIEQAKSNTPKKNDEFNEDFVADEEDVF
tara:strand:- start:1274 stop:1837 length:564 start_codon:yes stop_codon:yes gene_type:complete